MPATAHLVNLDIKIIPGKIGYIMGSGDEIPRVLTQLGYNVDLLSDEELNSADLSGYKAIICGIRAFNTRKELARQQKRLIEYVENGGTWIVQHNTRFGFQVKQIGPYPISVGRDRISEEDAPLKMLIPDHPVFNYPNVITPKDFDNWVQERGLYFADSWEGKLYPLLSGQINWVDCFMPGMVKVFLYSRHCPGSVNYLPVSPALPGCLLILSQLRGDRNLALAAGPRNNLTKPPFFKNWTILYALVMVHLGLWIIIFYIIKRIFE